MVRDLENTHLSAGLSDEDGLAALVPNSPVRLTRYHGAFASHSAPCFRQRETPAFHQPIPVA